MDPRRLVRRGFLLLLLIGCVGSPSPDVASRPGEGSPPPDSNSAEDVHRYELGPFSYENGSPVFSELLNVIFWQLAVKDDRYDEGVRASGIRGRKRPRPDFHGGLPGIGDIARPER